MKEKKSYRKLILPLFLAFIMVLSIFGSLIGYRGDSKTTDDPSAFTFGKATFTLQNGLYVGQQGNLRFYVMHDPRIVNEFIPQNVEPIFAKEKVYLSSNPKENIPLAVKILYDNLKPYVNIFFACTKDVEGCHDLPLKTCSDAGDKVGVIVVEEGDSNEIQIKDSCIVLNGKADKLTLLSDALLLRLYGVK